MYETDFGQLCFTVRIDQELYEPIKSGDFPATYASTNLSIRQSALNQNEYCGQFLPALRFFLPHFAQESTSVCEVIYHQYKRHGRYDSP
ncbi:hypothetical protein ACFQ4A_11650, partial [Lentibacillus salinarum]